MTTEQIAALIGTIVGLPIFIEIAKKWFEGRNLQLQSKAEDEKQTDAREWAALQDALNREREVYSRFIADQKVDFENRLSNIEAKLGIIQAEAERYQKLYWEERVKREALQTRINYLEQHLPVSERIGNGAELG